MPPNPTPGFSESAIAICFRLTLRFFARRRSACGLRAIFIGLLAGATGQAPGGPIHGTVLFPQETVLTSTQANLASVATADFDGDGYADVVASSNNPDMIVWYRNNGDGTFGSQPYVIATFPTTAVGNVAVGDLDGDGRIDVAYWSGDQRVKWSRNVGGALSTGLFGYNPGDPAANQNLVSGTEDVDTTVSIGDVNGDGLPDILSATIFSSLVTPANNNIVAWYRNLGGGNFGWNAATPTGNRNVLPTQGRISPSSVRAGDLNGDGRPDVVVTFRNSGRMGWIRGGGSVASPIFTYVELTANGQVGGPAASVPTAQSSATTDLDGDGWPDLVCAATGLPTLVWFRNTSHDAVPTATFFGGPQTISGSLIGAYSVVSADLNSDGKTDLVAVAAGGNRVYRWENLGGGSLTQSVVSTAVNFPVAVAAADFNLDGVPDAVSASNGNSTVAAYLNRGGQCALVTADTAPATITEGRKDDVLRIAVSNRGVAGDNSARVFSLTLLFERSAGIPLTTAEANALIDTFYVYLDSNNSGTVFGS